MTDRSPTRYGWEPARGGEGGVGREGEGITEGGKAVLSSRMEDRGNK